MLLISKVKISNDTWDGSVILRLYSTNPLAHNKKDLPVVSCEYFKG